MELVPVAELRTPATRGLDGERLRSLLRGIAAGGALPAVPVFREPDAVVVLNGMHRVAIARVGRLHPYSVPGSQLGRGARLLPLPRGGSGSA